MNKAQLIEKVADDTENTRLAIENVIDATIQVIQSEVSAGNHVKIAGFGTFCLVPRQERKGRNPQTGIEIIIPATKAPKFKPGKEFKELLSPSPKD